jgi:hypothetical protein
MMWAKYVAEGFFFLLALPLFGFQTFKMLQALVELLVDYTKY